MDFPVSEELKSQLSGQTTRMGSAPTETMHLMKWANDLLDREEEIEEDHSPSGVEVRPNGCEPRLQRVIRARPFLALIDCTGC